MRLIKLLIGSLAATAVVAAVLVTTLFFLDLGMFRGQLESAATGAFDRRVTFAGSIRLKPSLRPLIVVEDMRIGNPDWASRPDFAHVARLELRVAFLPLLRGELDVLDVIFNGADVLLEVGPGDSNNFTFGRRVGPPELPDIEWFTVRDSVLGYRDARGELESCGVNEFEATNVPGQPISVAGQLTCRDVPLRFSVSAGSPEEFESATSPWPLKTEVSTGDATLAAEGFLPKPRLWDGAEFRVSLQGAKVDSLEDLFDVTMPVRGPFDLSAQLRKSEDALTVSGLKASFGSTDISGDLTWNLAGHRPVLKGELASRSLQLKDLFAAPEPGSADKQDPEFLDRQVPLDWLTAIDAELELAVGLVVDSPMPIRDATGTMKLNGGKLALSPLNATLAEIPVTGDLTVAQAEDAAEINFAAQTERLDLGNLLDRLDTGGQLQGSVEELTLTARSRGRTTRALLKGADLSLKTQEARITSGDKKAEKPWTLDIAAAEIRAREAQPTEIRVQGNYRGAPLELFAETMTLEALASETESWPVSLAARSADAKLAAEGAVNRKTGSTALEFQATLEGDRIAALNPLLGASLPDVGPYRFSAALRTSEQTLTVSGLKGKIGSTDITGELQWIRAEDRPLLKGKLASQSLHVRDLGAAPDQRSAGRKEPEFLDRPLSLDWLAAIDADLELDVRRVVGSPVPIRDAAATAKLVSGQLTLAPTRATLAGIPVQGGLNIALAEGETRLGLTAQTRRLDVGNTLAQLKAGGQLQGSLEDLRLDLSSRGRTMRSLLKRAEFSLKTQKGRIRKGDKQAGNPWSFDITTAEIKAGEAQPISISVNGEHRAKPFALAADIVTLEGLVMGARPWPLDVSLQALDASLKAEGRVNEPFQGRGIDLSVEASGKDLRKLDPLIDYVIPLRGEFRVKGHFSEKTNRYALSDIQLQVGQSDIGGSLVLDMEKPRLMVDASLRSRMVHYDDLEFVEGDREPEERTRVIPEYELPIDALRAVDFDIDLKADKIRMRRGDLGDLVLRATLENGKSAWSARVTNDLGGRLTVQYDLDANADPPVNNLLLTARELNYGLILTSAEVAEFAEGTVDVDIALAGPGATQHDFLAQANGRITAIGGPGRIASQEYGLWSSDLVLTMLTASWRREAMTEINCIVGHIDVKDGVAKTDKLLLDTTRLTIAGSGTLDLDDEKLDLVLSPRPKQARLVSVANPVRVTGTLTAPEVAVTVLPSRRRAATGLLAGLVNPALLVFTFSDLGSGGGNPCVAATEKLEAAAGK